MKKKIAFISEHASPLATLGGIDSGGQNLYVDKLTKELAKIGYEIDIFTRLDDSRLPEVINCRNGIRVIHIKAGPPEFVHKENLLPFMDQFKEGILTFMKKEGITYQLFHANFFMSGYVASEIKKMFNIPFIITFHALGKIRRVYQGKDDKFSDARFAIEEGIIKEADHIVAECPQDKEDLLNYYQADPSKIATIPCGFDPEEFYPIDKKLARIILNLNEKEKIILQLGRMVPRKGVDNVIKAVSLLLKKQDLNVKLLVVGGESEKPNVKLTPEIARLQQIAKEKGIADKVVFLGRKNREQLKFYYNSADVFVSTPWYEPFGITPLEAMACGTPVIGSRVGGIKFSVVDKITGFLVTPNSPQELSKKLQEVLNNPKLQDKLKENSLSRVNSFFTWGVIANKMASLYEKILFPQYVFREEYQTQSEAIENNFSSLISTTNESLLKLRIPIINAAYVINHSLENKGKILVCGNGGSAADSQHFAAELVGHFQLEERIALPVISLTADTSVISALGNDFSYREIFARQVEAFGRSGDVLIGISTSGNSKNVIEAFKKAQEKKMICIGLLGKDGGETLPYCDVSLIVPSYDTQRIQEIHTHLIHTICELVEKHLFGEKTITTLYPTKTYQPKSLILKGGIHE